MTTRCLIIDDEPLAVELLEEYIRKIPFLSLEGKCYNALEALKFLQGNIVDLIFLDINLPDISGVEVSALLRKETKFIFTTAYAEYAVESYERDAFDYLLKPITFDRFLRSVSKYQESLTSALNAQGDNEKSDFIFIKSGKTIVQVNLAEVSHIEGMKDYAVFYTPDGKHILTRTLKELETQLPDFICRVHHSFFVNIKAIKKIEDNHIYTRDSNSPIPISGKYREIFMNRVKKDLL